MGQDKYGYAKTFGITIKVPRLILEDTLWRKSKLKESKSNRGTRKLRKKFISWRR